MNLWKWSESWVWWELLLYPLAATALGLLVGAALKMLLLWANLI